MKNRVVAFIGRAGSGKDYQCNLLQEKGYVKLAFAEPIRSITSQVLNIEYNDFLKDYDNIKERVFFNQVTGRNIMENVGSGIRNQDPDFFIRLLSNKIYLNISQGNNICISDMRYINEYKRISDLCKCLGVSFTAIFCDYRSSRYQEINNHESAYLSNILVNMGYKDLQKIREKDLLKIEQNS